jgi:uncharacterized protein YuzE
VRHQPRCREFASGRSAPRRQYRSRTFTTVEVRFTCTYDAEADAAYISFVHPVAPSAAVRTLVTHPAHASMVNLDLDGDDRVLGVEVLSASRLLPRKVVLSAFLASEANRVEWLVVTAQIGLA